jgi:hemolysin activation/secretion protein
VQRAANRQRPPTNLPLRGSRRARAIWLALAPAVAAVVSNASGQDSRTIPTTAPATRPATGWTLPPVEPDQGFAAVDALEVRGFRFTGNDAIGSRELNEVAARARRQFTSATLTLEQLERIRQSLTTHYVGRGYINSGAILPDQTVSDGIIHFEIVEGRLSAVEIATHAANPRRRPRLRERYVAERISVTPPLKLDRLGDQLELLRQDPSLRQISAELQPGFALGESILKVDVVEAPLIGAELSFNNHHTPSSGAERFDAFVELRNPTGLGDALSFTYGITEGGWDEMRWAGDNAFGIGYTVPLTARGTTLALDYQRSDELVIEQPFAGLDIASVSDSFSLTLRHPVRRSPTREFAMFASAAYRTSETFLAGEPFSFEPAAQDGRIDLAVLRLGAEYTAARRVAALSLRGSVNVGSDAFGATDNPDGIADGQFVYFLGQAGYVHRLGDTGTRLALRGAFQLAGDSLPSLEQFPIGGHDSVRGYRENRLVRDSGVYGAIELHLPLPGPSREGRSIWELVPFVDAGYGEDRDRDGLDETNFISSVGLGIVASPIKLLLIEVFYGYPFEKFPNSDDLQDEGLHFAVRLRHEF